MAVTVTDRRTVRNQADAITGWNTGEVVTDFFAEAPACIGVGLNTDTGQLYHTGASINLSNTIVYVYSFNNALQSNWDNANPPNALHLGDGTNRVSFRMAGANRRVFNHLDGPTEWQCLVLDGSEASTMNTNGLTTVRAGSFGGLNLSAITQIGSDFTTLSKALGGGQNVGVDIIRFGNDGLRVTGGTTGDEGTFLQIVLEDRSTADLKAHGMIRELITDVYGCQGPITFGNVGAATESRFIDAGIVLAYENRNIGNDKYYLRVEGNTGSTNVFSLTDSTITTAGPNVTCDFSFGNINTFILNGVVFSALGNTITFSNSADSIGHDVIGCTFAGCGRIDPGTVTFDGNTISNSTNLDGALLIDSDGTSNMSDLTFNRGTGGHGIIITEIGTYELTSFSFNNFGADGTTTASIYNNSGGLVTLNILGGGDPPTIRNGTGSTTEVNQLVTVTLTNLREDTEIRVFDSATSNPQVELAGTENATGGSFDDREFSFSLNAGTIVDIVVHSVVYESLRINNFTIPSTDSTFPVDQRFDRNYFNPNT